MSFAEERWNEILNNSVFFVFYDNFEKQILDYVLTPSIYSAPVKYRNMNLSCTVPQERASKFDVAY